MTAIKQIFSLVISLVASATVAQGIPKASDLFMDNCATCHGENLAGGMAGSLLDDVWIENGSTPALTRIITDGLVERGMPAWGNTLSSKEIRSLVIYIDEQRHRSSRENLNVDSLSTLMTSQGYSFSINTLYIADSILWALEYLPDGTMLATQRDGELLQISSTGTLIGRIKGLPDIWHHVQGGLLDITLHPEYEKNGWIYLAYASSIDGKTGATKIARGKIKDGYWVDHENIFEAPPKFHTDSGRHFGARIVLKDGYVFFSTGDRADRPSAQDLSSPNGKVFRLYENGQVPQDNPFVEVENAISGVWSYGHRNPQGMVIDSNTGLLWQVEHGPRGGDELNVIKRGENYGWPEITYGMNYDGTPITHETGKSGMAQPKHYWVPSISPAGMAFYTADLFSKWKGNLLIGGLGIQDLQMYNIENGEVSDSSLILTDRGRIRDISIAPDGSIHLIVTIDGKGHILRLTAQ